jgi:osmotically inducible lipoprotein OsmB
MKIFPALLIAMTAFSMMACSPDDRVAGGAVIGGLTGAAIGGAATGRVGGALAGAAVGTVGGAVVAAATAPQAEPVPAAPTEPARAPMPAPTRAQPQASGQSDAPKTTYGPRTANCPTGTWTLNGRDMGCKP